MTMHIIINRLGKGKTTLLAWMAWVSYLQGKNVFSNFRLNFPFFPIKRLEDLDKARKGFMVIDDAYMWFYRAKGYNPWADKILACSRKRGLDIAYTMTRSNQIDVNLRCNTEFVWIPVLLKQFDLLIAPKFLYYPDRGMKGGDEERVGELMEQYFITNISDIWSMFNTEEEIGELEGLRYDRGQVVRAPPA